MSYRNYRKIAEKMPAPIAPLTSSQQQRMHFHTAPEPGQPRGSAFEVFVRVNGAIASSNVIPAHRLNLPVANSPAKPLNRRSTENLTIPLLEFQFARSINQQFW